MRMITHNLSLSISCLILSLAFLFCLGSCLVFLLTHFLILVCLFSSWLCFLIFNLAFYLSFCFLTIILVVFSFAVFLNCDAFCHVFTFLFPLLPILCHTLYPVLGSTFIHDLRAFCCTSYFDEIITQDACDKYGTNFIGHTGKWLCEKCSVNLKFFVCEDNMQVSEPVKSGFSTTLNIIPQLPQCLWSQNLPEWWLTVKGFHP